MSAAPMPAPSAPVIPIGPHAAHAAHTARATGAVGTTSRSAPSTAELKALQLVPHGSAIASRQGPVAAVDTMEHIQEHPRWLLLGRLPTRMSAGIPLPHFKVRDLLALKEGYMIHSAWESTSDVLLKAGGVHLCWSEFEVVEQRMAMRITRLA